MNRLLLIDGHNLLFRMFYGIPRPVYNSKGQDIKAVMGFVGGISKLIKTLDADRILVVFDSETSTSDRLEDYAEYKKNRIDYSQLPDEENPFSQLPMIMRALDQMQVAYHVAQGYEADDYIASVCRRYHDLYKIYIVSTDSDFNQLVRQDVTIFNPRGKEGLLYTPQAVEEKFGVRPDQVVDFKSLLGDTADNITGVKGIGKKRAAEILTYGSLIEILKGQTTLPEKYFTKLMASEAIILRNQRLIQMLEDLPCPLDDGHLTIRYNVNQRPMDILRAVGIA